MVKISEMEERKQVIADTVKQIREFLNTLGDGSEAGHLSDMYLANSFDSETITGQNYEDLAIAYFCLNRFYNQVTLEPVEP